jgi:hypothetical protein
MENYKKIGKSSHAKHLRRKKGNWTKTMANCKSRSKSKLDVKKSTEDTEENKWSDFKNALKESAHFIKNKFDKTEWKW